MNMSGFIWNPCEGINCSKTQTGMDCAVCQNSTEYYMYNISCGKLSDPVWMWDTKTLWKLADRIHLWRLLAVGEIKGGGRGRE